MSAASPQPSLSTTQPDFEIRFPDGSDDLDQDEEWFEFKVDGRSRKLRIHDYAELYEVPGLYEALVYDKLACRSPQRLAELFAAVLSDWRVNAQDLRVLDLGAGNGIVAEELCGLGVRHLVGLDRLPEADLAAQRDRPRLYAKYLVTDLSKPSAKDLDHLELHRLNSLVTVAALGFGDIAPEAFSTAFNLIAPNGWLGMTIKTEFLDPDDESGFARFVKAMIDERVIEIQAYQRYCHRLSITGDKLLYVAIVARKKRDIPTPLLREVNECRDTATNNHKNADHIKMLL